MNDESNSEGAVSQAEDIIRKSSEKTKLSREMFGPLINRIRNGEQLEPTDQKAIEIRDHCLKLIRALNSLLPKPILESGIQSREQAVLSIGEEPEKLKEMGIKPNMHDGNSPDSFKGNPLKAAEYAASQLIYGIRDHEHDFVWQRESEYNMTRINLMIQGFAELGDIYLGDQLGTSKENLPKQK